MTTTNPTQRFPEITEEEMKALQWLAQSQGITPHEALRKALADELYLRQEVQKKSRILIKRVGGKINEIQLQ